MIEALQPQVATDKHRIVEIDETGKITRKTIPPIYTLAHKRLIRAYKCDKELFFYEKNAVLDLGRPLALAVQKQATEIVLCVNRKLQGGFNL